MAVDGERENTNEIAIEVGELMDVKIAPEDISVSHRLKSSRDYYKGKAAKEPRINVKFTRRDVKEKFYKAREKLKNKTTSDLRGLGYWQVNKIYLAESLTEINKKLFKSCLKVKKQKGFQFLWTSNGKICMRRDKDSRANIIADESDLLNL